MRILVVDDDGKMGELLHRGLTAQGHSVETALDGVRGLEKATSAQFDVILLDVMMPGMDGLAVARRLRSKGARVPIVMLTAKDSDRDIIRGLDAGADDYLVKPVSLEVLSARLRVIERRSRPASPHLLRVADLTLDAETHEVSRGGIPIALTKTEYLLLECLMRGAGRVLSRENLIQTVWGHEREIESNGLDVFVFLLRNKLEGNGASRLVQTVRGFGFTMREFEE